MVKIRVRVLLQGKVDKDKRERNYFEEPEDMDKNERKKKNREKREK